MLVTLLGMIVFWQPIMRVLVAVLIIALQFSRLSYTVLPLSTIIDFKLEQLRKALCPILVTLLGIVTEVREEQLEKAIFPILVMLLGIVTEVKEEQL